MLDQQPLESSSKNFAETLGNATLALKSNSVSNLRNDNHQPALIADEWAPSNSLRSVMRGHFDD
jgi:hypothetical protein